MLTTDQRKVHRLLKDFVAFFCVLLILFGLPATLAWIKESGDAGFFPFFSA